MTIDQRLTQDLDLKQLLQKLVVYSPWGIGLSVVVFIGGLVVGLNPVLTVSTIVTIAAAIVTLFYPQWGVIGFFT